MQKHSAVSKDLALWLMALWLCAALIPAAGAETVSVASAPLTTQTAAVNGMVRVYLSSLGSPAVLNLKTQGSYSVSITGQQIDSGSSLTVELNRSTGALVLTCNGQKTNMGTSFSLRRHSSAGTSGLYIRQARESGNLYPGDLTFQAVSSGGQYTLYTVAHIYIENYLYGVLPYEMGNSTNIEALKAQAVAARTYTVRMMRDRSGGLYDVKDTTSDQVYRGTPGGNANCVAAVDATKGIVLMYGSSYITTYYSASNGGQTETARSGASYAYMNVKDDPFDYANPSSTVKKKTIQADLTSASNPAQLMNLLKTRAVSALNRSGYNANSSNTVLQTLQSVTPHTPKYASPSRLYTKMNFAMKVKTQDAFGQTVSVDVTVTCDIFSELESLLSMSIQSSKNELWSVSQKNGAFVLEARRYGHGMGLSQRGAMYMAKLGYRYDQILGFYYEGCQRVKHSFTNSILSAGSDEEQITVEPPADIDQETVACQGRVSLPSAGAVLAIRKERSASGAIIGTAGNGAMVEVLAAEGEWCQIHFGSLVGYAPASALMISGTPPQTPAQVSNIAGFVTVTAKDFVNLRAEGSMNGTVVGTAPAGAVLTVFSLSGSWAKVQYNALTAYASTGFLSALSSSYPAAENVSSGSSTAWIGLVEGEMAVVRESASMDAQPVLQLAHGAAVTVLADDGSWSLIRFNEKTGYVLSSCLSYRQDGASATAPPDSQTPSPEATPSPAEGVLARVTTENGLLNLRAQPMAGSMILTTIPRGAQVEVTQQGDTWCGVRYSGYEGYAMTRFLTLSGAAATPAPPTGQTGTAWVTTPGGSLNLRELPRSGSAILKGIPQGETVAVLERGDEWCRVRYGQTEGYVMTIFLTFQSQTEETPGESPSPAPSPSPEPTEESGEPTPTPSATVEPAPTPQPGTNVRYAVVNTASGSLNLRRDALTGSPVLARIPRGTTLQIEEKLAAWSRTTYEGQSGYVMNAFLRFLESEAESPAAPTETTGTAVAGTARVNTASGSLNLRAEPYAMAGVLLQIPQYATVQVSRRGQDWSCVSYGGVTGYVMSRYLSFSEEANANPPQSDETAKPDEQTRTAYVQTASGTLNLRESPSAGSCVLAEIPRGRQLSISLFNEAWAKTVYNGQTGYVMTRYLRYEQPETTPRPDEDSGEPDETEAVDAWVCTSGGALNLRAEPNGQGTVLAALAHQTKVKLLEEGNTWSLISYQGQKGYVMTRYLSVQTPQAASTPVPSPSGQETDWLDEMDPTLKAPTGGKQFAYILGQENVRLWPRCAENGTPLGTVAPETLAEVLLLGDTWSCIQVQSLQGYCRTEVLQMVEQ